MQSAYEVYSITKGLDHQPSIDKTEYSTMKQQPSLNTPAVYETINQ